MNSNDLLVDIHALEEELLEFERQYGIRSEVFYTAYQNGEESDDDSLNLDFGEWASVYRTWITRQGQYRNQIQREQQKNNSLFQLIRKAV